MQFKNEAPRLPSAEIRLDEGRTGVDVDLAQDRIAGINESMRGVCWNDGNATRFHLALFLSERHGGGAFQDK